MNLPSRHMHSEYMHFAKLRTHARYNLASSGVADCTLADLDINLGDLALHGANAYGHIPLIERIASRFGIHHGCVVTAGGCSFANHLAMASILSPGDEVLVEDPTYELLLATLQYLQAKIIRFKRVPEQAWRLDPDLVAARITPHTRLVVLTNLHNPSSALAPEEAILAVAAHAGQVGALVLIDEVYRELLFRDGVAHTSFGTAPNIVVTSSLTKAYGLSGLRCGWILAPADLALRMRRLNDLFAVLPPHIAECMSAAAFDQLGSLRTRANAMIDGNRAAYGEILGAHPGLDQTMFSHGTTLFPRLHSGDGDALFETLVTRFDTSVVPGRFFGMPSHIRIGLGGDPAMTRVGISKLSAALSE